MLSFAWPWMILLVPLPWILLYVIKKRSSAAPMRPPTIAFPKLQQAQRAFAHAAPSGNSVPNWQRVLTTIIWILLVVSLMRPEWVNDIAYSKNVGYDLMLAVDLSRSMDIVDFTEHGHPLSRIAATKKVVANFVRNRVGDRVGLIVFAEQAFLTIPLTLDTAAVSKLLNNLLVGMAGERTAIGDAIGIGVQNLRKRPETSRILILLTDGEDTASRIPPLEAAQIAKNSHIKIYTIGVGNKLDETLLDKIAEMTGGIYYKVTNVNTLQQVYEQIDQLEKSEASQQVLLIKTPLFYFFLGTALLLFAILFALSTKGYRLARETYEP
ncbi:MAG TPA: VWA domain-containing protein [Gammaproteobacteria bacterium]|nr:VWA domain-containing protein [Gammaproteobacteria bacterium]